MRNIIAIPVLGLAAILQSAIISQFPLLGGTADLVLVLVAAWALQEGVTTGFQWAFLASVLVSLVSSLPWVIHFACYTGIVLLAMGLQRRVWQVPLLAMLSITFFGTLILHVLTMGYLNLSGATVPLADSLGLITLPSVLLNMLIAIPVFGLSRDLAGWVFGLGEVQ
jgi:rod shape-determining protein MreD